MRSGHEFVHMICADAIKCRYCGTEISRIEMRTLGLSIAELSAKPCFGEQPTGAVRPLAEECEAAPTKTLESLFNCAEPVDFEEIIALCKECSACECGAETARCGGHSAWCPKA